MDYVDSQKYNDIVMDDTKNRIDYPLFNKKRPVTPETPPPSPPKK